MRTLISYMLTAALVPGLALSLACGGNDTQPEHPDVTTIDDSADDMGLAPLEEPSTGGEGDEAGGGDEGGGGEEEAAPSVVSGERSAIEGGAPTLRITAPRAGATIRTGAVQLRLTVTNWPLEAPAGRHVHVIIDNEPYIAVRDISGPLDLGALVQENLGHELAEGTHVVRVFPSRGHHESVKTAGAFATVMFHYRSATEGFTFDAAAPLLTYSRPKACNPLGERVLLDFYVSGAELGESAHRVRYSLDGRSADITNWVPHWIEGLSAGDHELRLQLIGPDGQPVAGPFNDTTRTFSVAQTCP